MKKNDGHIGTLIERYFDGTTTASEERELARYFRQAGDNIPDEWGAHTRHDGLCRRGTRLC